MLKYLDGSECLEVDIQEFECFLLGPDEPNVDIKHTAPHAREDRQHTFARQGGHEIRVREWSTLVGMKECSTYTS